jgi:uncharacterized membrane protein
MTGAAIVHGLHPERLATGPVALPASGVLATAVVVANPDVPGLVPVAGLWLSLALPTLLLVNKLIAPTVALAEALILGLASTLLALILGGLALNQALPLAGVERPLDRVPALLALDAALVALVAWRFDRRRPFPSLALAAREWTVLGLGAIATVGAVAGAVRLDNGGSGVVTLGALVVAAVAVLALLAWRRSLAEGVICAVLFLLATALLLMTSLRGWYITGHDIQQEFHALELTSGNGAWDISLFREPYNACLSVTILPTVLGRIARLHDPYVLKVVLQILFAVCPVLVYRIARRFVGVGASVLAAVYFMAFPTFFTDMVFLTRQEIAFIFLGAAYLVITDGDRGLRERRTWLIVLALGVVLSHYSTTYVLIAVMAMAWLAARGGEWIARARRGRARERLRVRREPLVITLPIVLTITLMAVVWTWPLTGTSGQLEKTVLSSASGVVSGGLLGNRSSDVSYSLLLGHTEPPAQRLATYRRDSLEETAAARAAGTYYPRTVVDRYPTPLAQTSDLPLTALGRGVSRIGVPVSRVNSLLRGGLARMLQVFLVIGLVAAGLGAMAWFRPTHEFFLLAAASLVAVLSQLVLPELTLEYGLLRAVEQGLFVLAPFVVAGSVVSFAWLGPRAAGTIAAVLGLTFFLSLTGVLPGLLGGYPAQLHLANSGDYYDLYYVQPEERAAVRWLAATADPAAQVQSERQSGRYASSALGASDALAASGDIYPTLLRPDSYVFLGESTARDGRAAVSIDGEELSYAYPLAMLDATKDLVYSNGRALVYGPPADATPRARDGAR